MVRSVSFACALVTLAGSAVGAVRLPYVFTHHMVLQRDQPAPVWGIADPGEEVTVQFGDQRHETAADDAGRWRVDLKPLSPGVPRELVVNGSRSDHAVTVRDVVVGDVWVCSGQSNMVWRVENSRDGALDLLAADKPAIRLLQVETLGSQQPLDDIDQAWRVCSRESLRSFSAVGFHFGKQLQESLGVPIGLIRTAWGGSACEAWAPRAALESDPLYADYLRRWEKLEAESDEATLRTAHAARLAEFRQTLDEAYQSGKRLPKRPWVDNALFHQHRPGNLYNARVLPLIPFAIKGVIWYQGESNANRASAYRELFPLTIQSWREAWGQGDFPFYWVQLADFKAEPDAPAPDEAWPLLREAQSMTAERLPNTGQAVIIDLGEANDIHPRNKRDVGLRLARLALSGTYGKRLEGRSPTLSACEFADGMAVAAFSHVGAGLETYDGVAPVGFAIAGADRVFHAATAKIVGKDRIELASEAVSEPVAVRYGWANNPVVNVYDSAWLPLTPFRTDRW